MDNIEQIEFEIPQNMNQINGLKILEILRPFKSHVDFVRMRVSITIPENGNRDVIMQLQSNGLKLADKETPDNKL